MVGDLFVGCPAADQVQHLHLARSQIADLYWDGRRRPAGAIGAQHAAGGRRIEVGTTVRHRSHGANNLLRRGILEQEPGCASAERCRQHCVVIEGRQDQHRWCRWAIHVLHAHVHQNHVRDGSCAHDVADGFRAVGTFADDDKTVLWTEDHLQSSPDEGLVVNQQHADGWNLGHHGAADGLSRLALKAGSPRGHRRQQTLDQPTGSGRIWSSEK